MTIEYDEAVDFCPLCGAYWKHDFEICAREHGFNVDKSQVTGLVISEEAKQIIESTRRLHQEWNRPYDY